MTDTVDRLEKTLKEQRLLKGELETELEAMNERYTKLQQDHEMQMSSLQQIELENVKKSSELNEKEEINIEMRETYAKQLKEAESLHKKICNLEATKTDLERDKTKLKSEILANNKTIDTLKHQTMVDKKNLNLFESSNEAVEGKLERIQQNVKSEGLKVKNLEQGKRDLQSEINQLCNQLEKQQRFIARLEDERDHYMMEGTEMAQRIDILLDEVRNSETLVYNYQKQCTETQSELKKQQHLYHAIRNDRSQLTKCVTEGHDKIADYKEKIKVLTHQFDQLKEEIIAREQDLMKEKQEKH